MKNEDPVKRKKIVHKLKHQLKTNWFISWWTLFALLLGIAGITVGSLALTRVNSLTPTPTPQPPNTGLLTVTDHQVIVVSNLNLLPQAGDNDIITIVVTNNQNISILNITITNDLTVVIAMKKKRSIVSNVVLCAANNYTSSFIPLLVPGQTTTCKATYILTQADVNGFASLLSNSTAVGIPTSGPIQIATGTDTSDIHLSYVPPENLVISPVAISDTFTGFLNGLCLGNACGNECPNAPCSTTTHANWTYFCDDTGSVFSCNNGNWTLVSNLFGRDGINAFTFTLLNFTQPPVNGTVLVFVNQSEWMQVGQILFIGNGAGYYSVVSVLNETQVVLENLGYSENALPGIKIGLHSGVSPAGVIGSSFAGGGGEMVGGGGFAAGECMGNAPGGPCPTRPGWIGSGCNWCFWRNGC